MYIYVCVCVCIFVCVCVCLAAPQVEVSWVDAHGVSCAVQEVCMYVCMYTFGGTSTRAYTRTQTRGDTPELRRVADTASPGLSAGRHST